MHCKVIKHNLYHNNVTASSNINISILKVTQQGKQKRRKSLRSKRPKQHQHKQRWELNEDRNEIKSGWKFFKQQGRGEEFQWSQSSICHQARLLLCNVCDFSCVWRHHDCLVRRESGDRTARRESPSASRFENQLKSCISLDYHDHSMASTTNNQLRRDPVPSATASRAVVRQGSLNRARCLLLLIPTESGA